MWHNSGAITQCMRIFAIFTWEIYVCIYFWSYKGGLSKLYIDFGESSTHERWEFIWDILYLSNMIFMGSSKLRAIFQYYCSFCFFVTFCRIAIGFLMSFEFFAVVLSPFSFTCSMEIEKEILIVSFKKKFFLNILIPLLSLALYSFTCEENNCTVDIP